MKSNEPERIRTATSETARDINRRAVLNLIRTQQPISRADLARLCGLQRSTISLIVEQLIQENWVIEGATGRPPRGRRPTFLQLNDERVIIGVDIRPIRTVVALSDVNGLFNAEEAFATPSTPEAAINLITPAIRRLMAAARGKMIEGIGISVPGRLDENLASLVFAPNLRWPEFDLRTPIAKATGLDVELENAANACVLAAVWFDHVEEQNIVVVTVSEGIGTGILSNGQLVRGLRGMAGEFGHLPLDVNGPLCGCGSRGCWEVFASNRASLRYYAESGAAAPGMSYDALLTLAGQREARAVEALEKQAHFLGRGMRLIVAGIAPERIVIVGDLTRSWPLFGPVIEKEVQAQVLPGGLAPRLDPAREDGMARLRGTVALVLQKHFNAS